MIDEKPDCLSQEQYDKICSSYCKPDAQNIIDYMHVCGYEEPDLILDAYQGIFSYWDEFASSMIDAGEFNDEITIEEAIEELKKTNIQVQDMFFRKIRKKTE